MGGASPHFPASQCTSSVPFAEERLEQLLSFLCHHGVLRPHGWDLAFFRQTYAGALIQGTQSRTSTELAKCWEIRPTKFYFSGLSTLWQLRGQGLLIRWDSLVVKPLDSWGSGNRLIIKNHVKIPEKTSMKATSSFSLLPKERLYPREGLKVSRGHDSSYMLCSYLKSSDDVFSECLLESR